jgi:hypothetical protein
VVVVVGVAVDSIDDCVHHHLHTAIVNREDLFFKFGGLTMVRQ